MEPVIRMMKGVTMSDRRERLSRRAFVGGLTLAGTASLLGLRPDMAAGEPPPETTNLRIADPPGGLCIAPRYMADELI